MTDAGVTFDLLAKDRASRVFGNVGSAVDRVGDKVDHTKRRFAGLGAIGRTAGKALAVGLGAGVAGIGVVLAKGFGEVSDAAAGAAQSAAVIKSTGGAAHVTAKQVSDLAGAIQGYSGQTDDSIVAAENMLLTFTNLRNGVGKGNDIFTQATKIAADMGQAFGKDAGASAIQLGKALNDPVKGITALTRVGVTFSAGQKKTIASLVKTGDVAGAQKVILAELNKEFGGSAKAFGESIPGQVEKAKRSFEDMSQTAVTALLPLAGPLMAGVTKAFTKATPVITGIVKGIKVFFDALTGKSEINEFSGALKLVNNVGVTLGGIIATIVKAVRVFFDAFRGRSEVNEFEGGLKRVNNAGIAVAGFVTGTLIPAVKGFASFVTTTVIPAAAGLANFFVTKILPAVAGVARAIMGGLRAAFDTISKKIAENRPQLESLLRGFRNVADFIVTKVVPILGPMLALALRLLGRNIGLGISAIGAIVRAFHSFTQTVGSVAGAIGRFVTSAAAAFGRFKTAVGKRIGEAIDFVKGIPGRVVSAIGDLGSLLYEAGRNVIGGLIRGITDRLGDLAGAVGKAASVIRDHLPFSPAKVGPLSGKGNPFFSGQSIPGLVAAGINSRSGVLAGAMSGMLSPLSVPAVKVPASVGVGGVRPGTSIAINVGGVIGMTKEDLRSYLVRELDTLRRQGRLN